jgi:hypothetical protein
MGEEVSERVVDQRLRNRIMYEMHSLTEGISLLGVASYFNCFFDYTDMHNDDQPLPNSTMTEEEQSALAELCQLMNLACDVSNHMSDEELIASGWIERIKPKASEVLKIFLKRGLFGEDVEESEPSVAEGQPWYEHVSRQRT